MCQAKPKSLLEKKNRPQYSSSSSSLTLGPAYPPQRPPCPCSQSSTLGRGLKLSLLALPAFLPAAAAPTPTPCFLEVVLDERLRVDVPNADIPEGNLPCPKAW